MVLTRRQTSDMKLAEGEPDVLREPKNQPASAAPGLLTSVLPRLLLAVLRVTAKTVFSLDPRANITRTAVFLIIFLVVHMAGNLSVFFGANAFNAYGHLLNVNPLLKFIEAYLLLAACIHAVLGAYLTYNKWNMITKDVPTHGKLALSSIVVLIFIVIHLLHFKYGTHYEYKSTQAVTVLSEHGVQTVPAGTVMRDIYRLHRELFTDPTIAWGYAAAVGVLGAHLWWGWTKAAAKPELALTTDPAQTKEYKAGAIMIGQFLIVVIVIGFASGPIWMNYHVRQQ